MKQLNNKSMGVVIFAFDNASIDYQRLAVYCANRVIDVWGLPVTIVTDKPFSDYRINCVTCNSPEISTTRFYKDFGEWLQFLNGNRNEAWFMSPYEKTIVIDSDFLVSTTQVLDIWDGTGVKLSKTAYSLDTSQLTEDMRTLGPDGLPMYWATIVCFDRSKTSEMFFKYWAKAVRWYKAYSNVYNFQSRLMRNDFCVTVALDLLAQKIGSTEPFTLPYNIPTANFKMEIVSLNPLKFLTHGTVMEFAPTDVHVLNKKPLLDLLDNDTEEFRCTPTATRLEA
jgi:hypothetical protein